MKFYDSQRVREADTAPERARRLLEKIETGRYVGKSIRVAGKTVKKQRKCTPQKDE